MNTLQHGIQPFWFWNGEMDDREIERQIGEMAEKGFHGFLIHPRQGMEVPYLSETYFEKVRVAVNEAKKRGMEVWLYDEFPYPSGVSGGKVTLEHPEYSCLELTKTTGTFHGGETAKLYARWGKVVMAKAYPVEDGVCRWDKGIDLKEYVGSGYRQDVFQMSGLTEYNKKRYFQGELSQYLYWNTPEGTWKIYLYTEVVMKHFKYFETFIDPLNPMAVRAFLDTTHEQYKKHLGDEFGKTIRGVFTDEVTAFPPSAPWSRLLPGLVKEQSGLDLTEYLPALTEDMGEITASVRYAYWNAATEQFIQSWDKQVYDWCEENNLMYIGEKPILRSSELRYTHVPGIDAGHQKFGSKAILARERYRANGKIASSAAHFYQKPAALCEAFHSIGWGMTLQDCKWIFDWLTVMGIDWFITHGAYYTSDALKKHDAPPSFFYQMPWWRDMPQLTEYTDRLNQFLMTGKRRVSVLLIDPVTSTWTEIGARKRKLTQDFGDFQNLLLRNSVDYYVIDPQLFAEGTVSRENGAVSYCIGKDQYPIVVLPYMTNLEKAAYQKLQEYAEAGGTVICAGTVPYRAPECVGDNAQNESSYAGWLEKTLGLSAAAAEAQYFADPCVDAAGNTKMIAAGSTIAKAAESTAAEAAAGCTGSAEKGSCFFESAMENAVSRIIDLEIKLRVWTVTEIADKEAACDLLNIQKQMPDGREDLFVTNLSDRPADVVISFGEMTQKRTLAGGESLFLDSAEIGNCDAEPGAVGIDGAAAGCCCAVQTAKETAFVIEWNPDEVLPMKAESWNALRIGQWEMTLADGRTAKAESYPVIDQMEDAGLMIPIHQKDYFGCPKELEFPAVDAVYSYRFLDRRTEKTPVLLVMEPGTLLGEWKITVNDTAVYTEKDFVRRPAYLPSNLAVDLSDVLTAGENRIVLEIKTDKSFGGIRNPLYLCGEFGVERAENGQQGQQDPLAALVPVTEAGKMTDLTACGYPYYAGSVLFERKLSEKEIDQLKAVSPDTEIQIVRAEQVKFHEAVRIQAGTKPAVMRAFAPYDVWARAKELLAEPVIRIWYDTSASRLFEGETFDENAHKYKDVMAQQ